jgi:hypothetical protein
MEIWMEAFSLKKVVKIYMTRDEINSTIDFEPIVQTKQV